MAETKDGFYSRFKFWIDWAVTAVTLLSAGAGIYHVAWWYHSVPPLSTAKIIGPQSIEYAGQYALFHVDSLGREPKHLIYTWGVEPLMPQPPNQPLPLVRPTGKPGEAQLDTVAGRWRLSVSVADPVSRSGQMVSIDVSVPHEGRGPVTPVTPINPVNPKPDRPDKPVTPDPPPPPPPSGKFDTFTIDVQKSLVDVTSPDKAAEIALMSSGASDVSEALRTGRLSHLGGLPLRIAVVSEIMATDKKIKNASNWAVFGQKVNTAASGYVKSGDLVSAADWADFLTAFAAGLK